MASIGPELERTDRRIQQALIKGLRHAAVLGRNAVIREIVATRPHPPIDLGEMVRVSSWPITPLLGPGGVIGWVLESTTVQASVMEFGTRPFWPPLEPLEAWAARKLRAKAKATRKPRKKTSKGRRVRGFGGAKGLGALVPKQAPVRGKRQRQRSKAELAEAKRMAKAVRYAISKRGIRPRGFYARASAMFETYLEQSLSRYISSVDH